MMAGRRKAVWCSGGEVRRRWDVLAARLALGGGWGSGFKHGFAVAREIAAQSVGSGGGLVAAIPHALFSGAGG